MKCFQQTFRVEGLVGATVGLMFLATGCETVEHYSLTYKLWNNDDFRKHSEPAPNPNLMLFDTEDRGDVLVQYDALGELAITISS